MWFKTACFWVYAVFTVLILALYTVGVFICEKEQRKVPSTDFEKRPSFNMIYKVMAVATLSALLLIVIPVDWIADTILLPLFWANYFVSLWLTLYILVLKRFRTGQVQPYWITASGYVMLPICIAPSALLEIYNYAKYSWAFKAYQWSVFSLQSIMFFALGIALRSILPWLEERQYRVFLSEPFRRVKANTIKAVWFQLGIFTAQVALNAFFPQN
jgi:hypothetical protein